ncbi:LysR family transcriptional regulator [Neiella marina]|uniref:LysR family transcriptional regulator n=1 Tax=Neiella holothuriorum TaxID=2870530 RepID=A0ABS7EDW2_9GAMM|nr:LysR substrate-binding domain-containing protein [Neiella holothuriorum]MBW8190524.1 LysR family transcriptional regulator [Neiella holothuriorum]
MRDLSIRQLRVFASTARHGSLGEAAEQLFMTRSAASQALKGLEQQLGVTVFDRVQQRLVMNSHGHMLLPLAVDLLACQQGIWEQFSSESNQGQLRIGASLTIGNFLLPKLLADLKTVMPLPEVSLANSSQLQLQLKRYDIDIALIESNVIDRSLQRHAWTQDEMIVIAPTEHPLAEQVVDWQQLSAQDWVLREPSSGSREQFEHHIAPKLKHMNLVLELNSIASIIASVAAGLGLSLASRLACQQALDNGEVSQVLLPERLHRQFFVVYPDTNRHLPQLNTLLKQLGITSSDANQA